MPSEYAKDQDRHYVTGSDTSPWAFADNRLILHHWSAEDIDSAPHRKPYLYVSTAKKPKAFGEWVQLTTEDVEELIVRLTYIHKILTDPVFRKENPL